MTMTYIESLREGLTIRGRVLSAGQVVGLHNFTPRSAAEQVNMFGKPLYRVVPEEAAKARGASTLAHPHPQSQPKARKPKEAAPAADITLEPEAAPAGEFDVLVGRNVAETLAAVAGLDDDGVARFLEWERANANRSTVLSAFGTG